MNLLLFLSAILSALTGVMSGGRVAEVQVERSYGATSTAQAAIVRLAPMPATRSWLALADGWASPAGALSSIAPTAAPVALAPLYLDRPRE